ncbi:MAG: hypothetical protein K0Q52_366 [Microbacterium sp.]|jgi:hypothetical protein|nr:hypothetical protein [Microbacterium sp.]
MRMAQRCRLCRPAGKLNRSEAEEKRSPVPPPLMLFLFSPSHRELQRAIEVTIAVSSAEKDGYLHQGSSAEPEGPAGCRGYLAILFRWKVGDCMDTWFGTKWHQVSMHGAQRRTREERPSILPDAAAGTRSLLLMKQRRSEHRGDLL